jgi:single-strand DNA-binding protein
MNLGIFTGRLGRDAELNRIPTGDPVLNFSVAVEVGTKANPKAMWVEGAIFGNRATALQPYLLKGTKVTVSGRVSMEIFKARDGGEKATLKLNVSEIDLHGGPRDQAAAPSQRQAASAMEGPADEDIPF